MVGWEAISITLQLALFSASATETKNAESISLTHLATCDAGKATSPIIAKSTYTGVMCCTPNIVAWISLYRGDKVRAWLCWIAARPP